MLEFLWVELVEWLPGPPTSGIRIWGYFPVLLPDLECCICFIDVVARRGVIFLQGMDINYLQGTQLGMLGLGSKANRSCKMVPPMFECLGLNVLCFDCLNNQQGDFITVLTGGNVSNRMESLIQGNPPAISEKV